MDIIKSTREAFATPVQAVGGIVGKQRQTLPILSNILINKIALALNSPLLTLTSKLKPLPTSELKDRISA